MRILVCADVHAHNFAQFSVPMPYYGTSRLRHIAEALKELITYAVDHQYPDVVICGDLFHTRGMISVTVQKVVGDRLMMAQSKNITVHIVAGNHDQATKSGEVTSLDVLKHHAKVYTGYTLAQIQGKPVAFIPFREEREHMIQMFDNAGQDGAEYVFAHAAVNGAYTSDSEYQPKEQLEVADIKPDRFCWVFLGHYHRPQLVAPNALYCGSLCGHNFADTSELGFWSVQTNQPDADPVFHTVSAPRFLQFSLNTDAEVKRFAKTFKDNPDNFYKIKVAEGLKVPDFQGYITIEMVDKTPEVQCRIANVDRLSEVELIEAYVESKEALDTTALVAKGVELMNSARHA